MIVMDQNLAINIAPNIDCNDENITPVQIKNLSVSRHKVIALNASCNDTRWAL